MGAIHFDKTELGNLEYSLKREILSTNRAGGYMSTTIVCCNTRKYHGLVVCPKDPLDEENYVLLSSVDESIIQHDHTFNLAIHRFPGVYEPKGHKYITDFKYTPYQTITYRVGGVILTKDMLWIHDKTQLLLRYTLIEAKSPTTLRLRPFLAFRGRHNLSKANTFADAKSYPINCGVRNCMYEDFPWLHFQTNSCAEFTAAPEWYYNFEYREEIERGYPGHEDLLTTGYFETPIGKGESVIFSCSTEEIDPKGLDRVFADETARRSDKTDFLSCLRHSARQFIVKRGTRTEVIAGYPWFGSWGRDTFIALPGITLTQGNVRICMDVIETMIGEMKDGLFPNVGSAYNSVDAPLWFFWTLQTLEKHIGAKAIWEKYGEVMKTVLQSYVNGIGEHIRVDSNMLVRASSPTYAMTWMDAVVDGKPVTGRDGYQVEVNALWYNAVCYTLDLAEKFRNRKFVREWFNVPETIRVSFREKFWYGYEDYLADYVDGKAQNIDIRPNQIIACSLDYCMLTEAERIGVIDIVRRHLLTTKGLRTLSPKSPMYKGHIFGDQPTRDRAYHQGTVWPWLLEHYAKANFNLFGETFIPEAEKLVKSFDEDISIAGLASISEIYDGDPPHHPRGATSQAWSVGAVLRIQEMIDEYE